MSSSIITTESTQNDVLKPIGNLEHRMYSIYLPHDVFY